MLLLPRRVKPAYSRETPGFTLPSQETFSAALPLRHFFLHITTYGTTEMYDTKATYLSGTEDDFSVIPNHFGLVQTYTATEIHVLKTTYLTGIVR
jgi:hypothetical protein